VAEVPPAAVPSQKFCHTSTVLAVELVIVRPPVVPVPMFGYVAEPDCTFKLLEAVVGSDAQDVAGSSASEPATNAESSSFVRDSLVIWFFIVVMRVIV
jgi:hypothetical protein